MGQGGMSLEEWVGAQIGHSTNGSAIKLKKIKIKKLN